MNKKDEINKKSIIVGITSVAIIAIAIITVISIFTIKSHAQVQKKHEKVEVSVLKKSGAKTQKLEYKAAKNWDKNDKAWDVAKKVQKQEAKGVFKYDKASKVKDQDKDALTVAASKEKGWYNVGSAKSADKTKNLAVHKAFDKDKEAA